MRLLPFVSLLQDIKLDVAEECAKFGKVSKVDIPRIGQPNQGKVATQMRACHSLLMQALTSQNYPAFPPLPGVCVL